MNMEITTNFEALKFFETHDQFIIAHLNANS